MTFKLNKKRGFTLIDLLLSVAIISLISSITIYNTSEAKKKAEDAHMMVESDQVKKAVTIFREDKGRVPFSGFKNVVHIEGNPDGGSDDYKIAMQELVTGGYISEIPHSPNGKSYSYLVSEDGKSAVFSAKLNNENRNSNANSCTSIVSSELEFGACYHPFSRSPGGFMQLNYRYGPCEGQNYDPETHVCFDIANSDEIIDSCTCNAGQQPYSNSDNVPDDLCVEYFSSENNVCEPWYDIDEQGPENWICEYTGSNTTCDGSSDKDLCQCI